MASRWRTLLLMAGVTLLVGAHAGLAYVVWSHLALSAAALLFGSAVIALTHARLLGRLHSIVQRHWRFCR